jgi:NAD-dependent deacetylase
MGPDDLPRLLDADGAYVVVVTGAGISVASGLPTFRGSDPDAVWSNEVMDKATLAFFERDPVASLAWYLKRFDGMRGVQPNAAHHALAQLERTVVGRGDRFCMITQNIDGLHVDAGSERLIEVHGAARKLRCTRVGCEHGPPKGTLSRDRFDLAAFAADPSEALLPRCPSCGALVRPHVLWFDEYYQSHEDYGFDRVESLLRDDPPTVLVFIGTSFSVGLTEALWQLAVYGRVPTFVIDPHFREPPTLLPWMAAVREPAEELLPRIVG